MFLDLRGLIEVYRQDSDLIDSDFASLPFNDVYGLLGYRLVHGEFKEMTDVSERVRAVCDRISDFHLHTALLNNKSVAHLLDDGWITQEEHNVLVSVGVANMKEYIDRMEPSMVYPASLRRWWNMQITPSRSAEERKEVGYSQTVRSDVAPKVSESDPLLAVAQSADGWNYSEIEEILVGIPSRSGKFNTRTANTLLKIRDIIHHSGGALSDFMRIDTIKSLPMVGAKTADEIADYLSTVLTSGQWEGYEVRSSEAMPKWAQVVDHPWEDLLISLGITGPSFQSYLRDGFDPDPEAEVPYFDILGILLLEMRKERDQRFIREYLETVGWPSDSTTRRIKRRDWSQEYDLSKERVTQLTKRIEKDIIKKSKDLYTEIRNHGMEIPEYVQSGRMIASNIINGSTSSVLKFRRDHYLRIASQQVDGYSLQYDPNACPFPLIIQNEVLTKIRIQEYWADLNNELTKSRTKDEVLDLKGHMREYLLEPYDEDLHDQLVWEIESCLVDYYPDLKIQDHVVQLVRTRRGTHGDHIEEILESLDRPARVQEIAERLAEMQDYAVDPNKLIATIRSVCQRLSHQFILCGQSTYGLKRWETEGRIRGGTITQVVKSILSEYIDPQHGYIIYREVAEHRDTSYSSMIGLINNKSEVFLSLKSGYIGVDGIHDADYAKMGKVPPYWAGLLQTEHPEISHYAPRRLADTIRDIAAKYKTEPLHVLSLLMKQVDDGNLYLIDADILTRDLLTKY